MEHHVIKELRKAAEKTGRSELAREIDVSPQLMCDVLAGRRSIGKKMLDYLGYERVVTYVKRRGK
jgi:hypothetical protein